MKSYSRSLFLPLLSLLLGCSKPPPGKGQGEVSATPDNAVRFKVETVASGLEIPWAMAFLPDGRMLVTERPGRIRIVENGTLRPEPIAVIREVEQVGESGLMDLILHPGFARNGFIFISYAYGGDQQQVRVARYHFDGNTLTEPKTLIEGIPAAKNHAGCRLGFGPDGKLYITTGDATKKEQAQDLGTLGGKTLRINDDGTVPSDNPFVGQAGARPEIWSYGHRNSQGICWQPETGLMFQSEHGPSGNDAPGGGDEVNIVERGKNYGWPVVHHRDSRPDMVSPLLEYTPAIAPGGAMFYTGNLFPAFKNNLFFAGLVGECLMRVELNGRTVVKQEKLLHGTYGRIRDVITGPDGAIYFCTSNRDGRGSPAANDDRVLKLVPEK
ncbi:MAG: PQQ-dependent sugar dehydrogenase [Chlorobi bacterium]|nr:PQQ-dependent sugar dehydrogenase [Chlorobiota bacterium]